MLGIATGASLAAGSAAAGGMGLGSFIGPAAGLIGSFFGDSTAAQSQAATNAAQMAMMKQNEQWQEQMSNTQMQRRVTDLKAAGLNPMLAVNTPGAAMPGFQQPNLQAPGAAFGNLGSQVTGAVQTAQIGAQIDQLKAQTNLMGAQATKTAGADTELATAQAQLADNTRNMLQPAQARAADAAAQLDEASKRRVDQQIQSGDIAQQIKLMQQQSGAAAAQRYMDLAIAKFNDMSSIEKQYATPLLITQLGLGIQKADLQLPEFRALASYYETKMGQLSFAQRQVESAIGTGADVIRALKPGLGGGSTFGAPRASGFPGDFGGQSTPFNP